MSNLSLKQQEVVKRAKEILKDEPWFKGICLDHLPDDWDIERDGVEAVAQQLVLDTSYWDGPGPQAKAG